MNQGKGWIIGMVVRVNNNVDTLLSSGEVIPCT
jgi:hypothetical protein